MACESTNGSTRMTWPFHVLEIVLSISLAMMSVRKLLQLVLWNLTIYQLLAINACVTKLGPRSVGYRLPWDKWWKNMKEVSIFCDTKHRPRLSWFTCCNATSATLQLHSETAQNWCPHKTRPHGCQAAMQNECCHATNLALSSTQIAKFGWCWNFT